MQTQTGWVQSDNIYKATETQRKQTVNEDKVLKQSFKEPLQDVRQERDNVVLKDRWN